MPPSSRSSRRSRHRSGGTATALSGIRRRVGRRGLVIGIVVLALVFFMLSATTFYISTTRYLDVDLDENQQVVLYAMGYPDAVREQGQPAWVRTRPVSIASANTAPATAVGGDKTVYAYGHWAYNLAEGGEARFDFDPDGSIRRISCMHPEAQRHACPGILGVELGDDEERPLWTVGNPTRSRLFGLTRTFHYDDIGVEYGLERRRVYRLAVTRSTGGFGAKLGRYFRSLVP